jgi:hypothetical protein
MQGRNDWDEYDLVAEGYHDIALRKDAYKVKSTKSHYHLIIRKRLIILTRMRVRMMEVVHDERAET